jgi:GT2 family glycosyltransferase
MCERFFLYEDDVDLCWRMQLAGWEVLFCPEAIVRHEYEFDKGTEKWFWLERNRLWTVLSNYSGLSLAILAPLLFGTELMVAAVSLRGGWAGAYMRAWRSTLRALGELIRWRRRVQAHRRVRDSEVLELMSPRFEAPQLNTALARAMNPLIAVYCRAMLAVVRRVGR